MRILSLLFILSVIFAEGLYAQKIKFGAEAGANLSGAIVKDPGGNPSGTPLPGFQLGGFAGLALPAKSLSVNARLLFSYEGYKADVYDTKATIHVSFLKLPVNLVYKPGDASGKWFIGLGPYLAAGIGGHYVSQDTKVSIHFGSNADNDDLKRFDIGADLMGGYQATDKILVRAAFDIGIINYLTPGSTADASAHTLSFGITAAYLLGGH